MDEERIREIEALFEGNPDVISAGDGRYLLAALREARQQLAAAQARVEEVEGALAQVSDDFEDLARRFKTLEGERDRLALAVIEEKGRRITADADNARLRALAATLSGIIEDLETHGYETGDWMMVPMVEWEQATRRLEGMDEARRALALAGEPGGEEE